MQVNDPGGPVVKTIGRTPKPTVGTGLEKKTTGKSDASSAGILSVCAVTTAGTCEEITVNSQ